MCVNGKKEGIRREQELLLCFVASHRYRVNKLPFQGLLLLFVDIICTVFFLTTTVVLSAFIGQSEKKTNGSNNAITALFSVDAFSFVDAKALYR